MTELDGFLPDTALELIEEFGKAVDYKLIVSGAYDPATGQAGSAETAVPNVKVAPPEGYSATSVSGSGGLIETGDKKLTTAALYFIDYSEPTPGDTVEFDGTVYTVQKVDTVYSGELPCLYILQVRG